MKVLLLAPAPLNISPGQRFRFEHYIPSAKSNDVCFYVKPFFTKKAWGILHVKKHYSEKILGIILGLLKRTFLLFTIFRFDFVYIYRETAPIGPPIFEWIIKFFFQKKIIYDFDDSIWISTASVSNPGANLIKCTWKVKYICKWSYIVTVGNSFLASFASKYCEDVRIIPTVVDSENVHNVFKDQLELPFTIGWTGTYTNFYNLDIVTTVIANLQKKYSFIFLIIANKDPLLKDVKYVYKKWNLNTEIEDLLRINIGIMPLANSAIELGKCAFKANQYNSLGIPAVVSSVGANKELITQNKNGFLAESSDDWYNYLEQLIIDSNLRRRMGIVAREQIITHYSVFSTIQNFYTLFKKIQS